MSCNLRAMADRRPSRRTSFCAVGQRQEEDAVVLGIALRQDAGDRELAVEGLGIDALADPHALDLRHLPAQDRPSPRS
jgi:hypothetical protein